MTRRYLTLMAAVAAATLGASTAAAVDTQVTIAHQTVVEPAKVAQADAFYEKTSGYKIDWRNFDSGADVIAAVASRDVRVGYFGSSPLAVAASRQLPIKTVLVAAFIGDAEQLVVRNGAGISAPEALKGKTIAVPFVSSTHYSLLAALQHWHINPAAVQILNRRPPEIVAAWGRGDIDGAYVWDPALGKIKENGKVLVSSSDVAKWGAPPDDAWIARNEFAVHNGDFVKGFVKVTTDAYADYRKSPNNIAVTSDHAAKIARLTGAKREEVPEFLAGSIFPVAAEQATPSLLGGGTAKAIVATSSFLVQQMKVDKALADYTPYVDASFIKAVALIN